MGPLLLRRRYVHCRLIAFDFDEMVVLNFVVDDDESYFGAAVDGVNLTRIDH